MSSSGFKQPENFDEVASQSDWSMYAGGNDWESGITWIAVRFGDKWRGNRVWIEVKHDNPDADQSTEGQKAVKERGDAAWKTWVKVAKRLKGQEGIYGYEEAFEKALSDPEMKPFVKQHGHDRETWSARESGQIVAAMLLEDENMVFASTLKGVTVDFDLDGTATAQGVIRWRLGIDAKTWGIQAFNPVIESLSILVDYEDYSEPERGEDVERQMQIIWPDEGTAMDTDDAKSVVMSHPAPRNEWTVEAGFDPGSPGPSNGLRPRFLDIRSRRKAVRVLF